MKIGLQLYTLRDELSKDFIGTLREVAKLGYKGVEFAGYGGLGADELKSLLDELGLEAAGSHVSYDRLLTALDEEIAYNKAIGNRYLNVPWLDPKHRQNDETWNNLFAELAKIGRRVQEAGLALGYHNHDFELLERANGQIALDAMFEAVDASLLKVELDTCWVHHAGYSPVEYIRKYSGRLPIVHFKDMRKKADGKADTVELGQGEVDLAAIAEASAAAGVEWLVVEQDFCQNPPLKSVENSMNWIVQYANQGGSVRV